MPYIRLRLYPLNSVIFLQIIKRKKIIFFNSAGSILVRSRQTGLHIRNMTLLSINEYTIFQHQGELTFKLFDDNKTWFKYCWSSHLVLYERRVFSDQPKWGSNRYFAEYELTSHWIGKKQTRVNRFGEHSTRLIAPFMVYFPKIPPILVTNQSSDQWKTACMRVSTNWV